MRRASLLAIALLVACSSDGGSSAPPATEALLGGTSMSDTPWPSDVFLVNGRIAVHDLPLGGAPASVSALAATLSELDGGPTHTSLFFPTSGGLTDGPVDGTARCVDLGDGSRAPIETKLWYREETKELVALAPAFGVFAEGATIGCVVVAPRVKPSAAMADALAGKGPFGALYTRLGALAAGASAATVFTVGHPTRMLEEMVTVAAARPPTKAVVAKVLRGATLDDFAGKPTTTRPGLGDPNGILHDAIDAVVLGTYASPSFLSDAPPKLGRVDVDGAGQPVVKGEEAIPFLLALPKKPASGWDKMPILIFQHGLNASRAQVMTAANDYARAGYATIGIDTIWHGDRSPAKKDVAHAFGTTPGPDGIADNDDFGASIDLFDFNGDAAQGVVAFDGRYVRDNFRQAVTDLAELVRFVQKGDLSALGAADAELVGLGFDGDNVVYTSESWGSVVGATTAAVTPTLKGAVLSVGGASVFVTMLPSSPTFNGLVTPFLRTGFDPELDLSDPTVIPGAAQRSLSLVQAAIAPGDPISFAPLWRAKGKDVLVLEARSDELIPNQATELMASAANATYVTLPSGSEGPRFAPLPTAPAPWVAPDGHTIAVVQLKPALHTMFTAFTGQQKYEPDFPPFTPLGTPATIDNPIELAHGLALGFAAAIRAGGPGRVEPLTR